MALNLVRNSKVFFTSNVDQSTGVIQTTGFTSANTNEIQVLDGFTFSQNTNADVVTITEAGVSPVRGQRSFNTSLAPVDFSLSSYLRPANATTSITAEESVLWNALLSSNAISTANTVTITGVTGATYTFVAGEATLTISGASMTYAGIAVNDVVTISGLAHATDGIVLNAAAKVLSLSATSITLNMINPKAAGAAISAITTGTVKFYRSAWAPVSTTYSVISSGGSNVNQLQKFGMIFIVDSVVYVVDNCAMNQVTIDFGLDAIATAAWTGQGTSLKQSSIITLATLSAATPKNTTAPFITNKLSTVSLSLVNSIGAAAAGTTYAVALTGGSITINNNITYVTPANLGIVNIPTTYYTGTRAITGSITAYLKTGSGVGSTGQLLSDMLAAVSSSVEPMAALTISVGGASNATKVVFEMPAITLSVPSVDVQQVVSTSINFTAEGSTPSASVDGNTFALDETNDISVRYYSA